MTEKVGLIKNPLTIIAIFAGIAEVSGTIVLPFISPQNQQLFIYFLICFPSLLVIIFFITLNFNNKVLYAPSDYQDEGNYIKINRYDVSKQKTIEVKIPKEAVDHEQVALLMEKIEFTSSQILKLKNSLLENSPEEEIYIEPIGFEFMLSNFENADVFIKEMQMKGIDFKIYMPRGENEVQDFPEHKAIWLGMDVPLKLAQLAIKTAKQFYPHLKYIKISDDRDADHNMVYIGGSTDTAVSRYHLLPLSDSDFRKLETFTHVKPFHDFINSFGDLC